MDIFICFIGTRMCNYDGNWSVVYCQASERFIEALQQVINLHGSIDLHGVYNLYFIDPSITS